MKIVTIEIETLEKLFEEIKSLKESVHALSQSKQLPDGENEWEYYTLDEALKLLGVTKKNWYKTYKNTEPKVIPYTQYGDKVWIKKKDLNCFLEKRRRA